MMTVWSWVDVSGHSPGGPSSEPVYLKYAYEPMTAQTPAAYTTDIRVFHFTTSLSVMAAV